jgi:hypothetical protein
MAQVSERFAAQKERILERLQEGPLTALEALENLGVMRMAARVHDLRADGHPIVCETVVVPNRFSEESRVARYSLQPEQHNQPTKQGSNMSEALDNNPTQAAGIIIASDNINQRQAISVAVSKGLKDAGFTNVTVVVDKSDDPSRIDVTPENAESLLGSIKALNPGLFDAPINILAATGGGAGAELVQDIMADAQEDGSAVTTF